MNVGLIGLGRHGTRYAQHLLDPQTPAKLAAICRRNDEQGQAFAQQHNVRFHQHYQSLIKDPEVDAIIVVTPPSLTSSIAIEAIQNNKPLLIEKPLAVSATDARQIVDTASQANVPVMTAHTLRYDPSIAKLKECRHVLGKWQYLTLTARLERRSHSPEEIKAWNGRGALLEIGIHLLDLARFLTGEEICEACCEIRSTTTEGPEDQVWGRLTTQSGLLCLLDISQASDSRMTRVELIGQNGQVSANWTTATVSVQKHRDLPHEIKLTPTPTIQHVLEDFVHALNTGTPMPISGEDGLRAVELAEACYQSAALKRAVNLERKRS